MKLFNIGPLELLLIVTIALIFLGPDGMLSTAKRISKEFRKLIRSPIWASIMDTSKEIREIPKKFMQESGLDESLEEITRMKSETETEILSIGKNLTDENEEKHDPAISPKHPIER